MAGLPRLPRLPRERAAKVRLPRMQRDRHDLPRLLVEPSEGLEALPDFLMRPVTARADAAVLEVRPRMARVPLRVSSHARLKTKGRCRQGALHR
jgi:hypothetical protein